jgi:hypothetical protein
LEGVGELDRVGELDGAGGDLEGGGGGGGEDELDGAGGGELEGFSELEGNGELDGAIDGEFVAVSCEVDELEGLVGEVGCDSGEIELVGVSVAAGVVRVESTTTTKTI